MGIHPVDHVGGVLTGTDSEKIPEVRIKECVIIGDGWERESLSKLSRHTHCTNVDPQNSLCRVVCPVP